MPNKPLKLVFATNNLNKLKEVQALLGDTFAILSLSDIGVNEDIPEDYDTLQDNARQKAWYIFDKTGLNCFADDTGLEVDVLNGEPGVYSARYAGEGKNPKDNIKKLLKNLQGIQNRSAQFRTVIALVFNGKEFLFEGDVKGTIIETELGSDGFGYDPIFIPNGYTKTFAQIPLELKNNISHRGKAVKKLVNFLKELE